MTDTEVNGIRNESRKRPAYMAPQRYELPSIKILLVKPKSS